VKFSELDQEYIKNYLFTSFDLTDDVAIFLNSLTFNDICVVLLPKNTKSYKLNLMNISYALNNNIGLSSRILIIVGKNSSLDLIETELGFFNKNYISNVVCEIFLDENSTLNHTKIINGDYTSLHLSNIFINQQVNSFYKLHQLSYKGCYINNNINVNLLGKRSYCEINGLDLASDVQYIKNVIRINHLVGNCKSKQLFKGIYTDKALGVFNGNIFVDAKSEGTNASQINKSILLSEDCDFMSNPNLKINADDVKCSHAATIGRFNKNELFFLRSRGLSVKEANFLLAKFFVSDVLCFKQDNKLKAIIIKKVNNWMNNNLLRI
jgi:Fe-S cluster assembly protein SufD